MKKLFSYLLNDSPLLWLAPLVLLFLMAVFPPEANLAPVLEILIYLGALALLYTVFLLLRGAVIRRRFLTRLARLCRERGYLLEIEGRWNLTLVVRTEAHTYSCAVVGGLRYRTPLLLTEGEATYAHLWGIRTPGVAEARYGLRVQSFTATVKKDYLFALARKRPLRFPTEGIRRVLIVNPCPRRVLSGTAEKFSYVPSGETVNDYLVFSGSGFCRMLECQSDVFAPDFARRGEL